MVLIPKPNKGEEEKTYRPLCLIDALAKLFEHIINGRLVKELEEIRGLDDHQHGFRRSHSTMDAIGEVLGLAKAAAHVNGVL